MKITVNNALLELHSGARVKDAIMSFFTQSGRKVPKRLPIVEDRFGNRVAHDGELTEGNALFIVPGHKKRSSSLKIDRYFDGHRTPFCLQQPEACGNLRHH